MKLCDILFLTIIALCLFSLAGCSDRSETFPIVASRPVLRTWTPKEECELALALVKIPEESVLWTLHDDWARMRREAGLLPAGHKNNCSQEKSTEPAFLS